MKYVYYVFFILHCDLMAEYSQLRYSIPVLFNSEQIEQRLSLTFLALQCQRRERSKKNGGPSLQERMAASLQAVVKGGGPPPRMFASPRASPAPLVPPVVEPENLELSPALQLQAPSSSRTQVARHQIRPQGNCGDQSGGVLKFLEATKPPMPYLLDHFINFGCLSHDFLYAVSMWSPENIRYFLESLPGPGGKSLTPMQVECLLHTFGSYFPASNPKA